MTTRARRGSGSGIERVAAGAFVTLVALTPLVPHHPLFGSVVSADDVLPAVATVVGIAGVLVTRAWRDARARLRAGPEMVPLALLIAISAIAAVHAGTAHALAAGPVRWLQYVILIGLAYLLLRTPADGALALRVIVAVAVLEAVIGLTAFVTDWQPGGHLGVERTYDPGISKIFPGRIDGTLGVASIFLAGLLALALPIGVALTVRATRLRRAGWLLCVVLIALTLAFTFSRVAVALAVAAVVVFLLVRTSPKVWVPVIGVLAVAGLGTPIRHRLLNLSNDRMSLWWAGAHMTAAHPLFGVGPGRYMTALPQFARTPYGKAVYTAHNSLLLAAAEAGVVAGVLLLAALILALRHLPAALAARYQHPVALGAWLGLIAFVLDAMTNDLYFIPSVAVIAWMVAPALTALLNGPQHAGRSAARQRVSTENLGPAVI